MPRTDAHSDPLACPGHAHLVGANGAGMRALADVLAAAGWHLTGSDAGRPFPMPPAMLPKGAARLDSVDIPAVLQADRHWEFARRVSRQRDLTPLAPAGEGTSTRQHSSGQWDVLIHSAAVPVDDAELQRARLSGVPVLSYPEMLGRISRFRPAIAVAGTHGKSSTVGMTADALRASGLDPTVIGGAAPLGCASGGRLGGDALLLIEACEYRRHFLNLRPRVLVLLPVEPDHFDCFPDEQSLEDAFRRFIASLPDDGLLIAAADCPRAVRLAADGGKPTLTFGERPEADIRARIEGEYRGRHTFAAWYRDELLGNASLSVPGRHNVQNALAALAAVAGVAHASSEWWIEGAGRGGRTPVAPGEDAATAGPRLASELRPALDALARFPGLHRRLEVRASRGGVTWIDDYAHHPTELRASLDAVRRMYPAARLTCVFQPHRAERTARLFHEIVNALRLADRVAVAEIFRAREGPAVAGEVDAADLAGALRRSGGVDTAPVHRAGAIIDWLIRSLRPGDVLLTAGAGDVDRIGLGWCRLSDGPAGRNLGDYGVHSSPETEVVRPCRG